MARKRAKASAGNAVNGGRRLVVVVAFDVVNFSALVEADEERVLGAWRTLRQAIDPLIVAGGGRIFKALGDGLQRCAGDKPSGRLMEERAGGPPPPPIFGVSGDRN
jgi:class 3 adenylate cyclase